MKEIIKSETCKVEVGIIGPLDGKYYDKIK